MKHNKDIVTLWLGFEPFIKGRWNIVDATEFEKGAK